MRNIQVVDTHGGPGGEGAHERTLRGVHSSLAASKHLHNDIAKAIKGWSKKKSERGTLVSLVSLSVHTSSVSPLFCR